MSQSLADHVAEYVDPYEALATQSYPAGFRHRARWNAVESRIEMHLESLYDQRVEISTAKLDIHFRRGETIHTENRYKFTDGTLGVLLSDSGFEIESTWKGVTAAFDLNVLNMFNNGLGADF